jgi:hypothetical protein
MPAEPALAPVLPCIATPRPELQADMSALADLLEWYRYWLTAPFPLDFSDSFGPLFLDLIHAMTSAPLSHPNAQAVTLGLGPSSPTWLIRVLPAG